MALVRGTAGRNKPSDGELRPVRQRPPVRRLQHARGGAQGGLPDRADRPLRRAAQLASSPIPLEIRIPALRCRGGQDLRRSVFEPLGWTTTAQSQPLQPDEWGASPYLDLRLTGEVRLADALNHLYVLLPVLDDAKHYWVSTEEVDKLIRAGGDWLAGQPDSSSPPATCRTGARSSNPRWPGPRWPGWPKPTTPSPRPSTTRSPRTTNRSGASRWPSSAARPSSRSCGSWGNTGRGLRLRVRRADQGPAGRPAPRENRRGRRVRPGPPARGP